MTPQEHIAEAIRLYPGALAHVSAESGISRARLCTYLSGDPGKAGYAPPSAEVAARVKAAVRRLLLRALEQLDNPELELDHWTRRGTPPGARHGNAIPKKDRQKHESPEVSLEAPGSA